MEPLLVIDTVALSRRHLSLAPQLKRLADRGWSRVLRETLPAVTCTAQATMLTGKLPAEHGVVGNGWLYRDTGEVRFWQQSNRLIQSEPVYATARRVAGERGQKFRCAKLFWWFNQGADVDLSVTPKPHYGADGNKAFDIHGSPERFAESLKEKLGDFPFHTFWGPMAGLACSEWIAKCAAEVIEGLGSDEGNPPDLTLVYLPHLDYDTQRLGPKQCDWKRLVGELDSACRPLLEAAKKQGVRVWVTNEYTHVEVKQAVLPNQMLRHAGLLSARRGPFGEMLDTFESRAFAVCDHQIAHVYVRSGVDRERVRSLFGELPGVAGVYVGEEREQIGLNHSRAGDVVALSKPDAWFAYPYWSDAESAPDFARTVDIHRKPGYDPCELLFDPNLSWAKGRAMRRLLQKRLGFRTLFDVVPLDPSLVKGSHGLQVEDAEDRPLLIGDGPEPESAELSQTEVHGLLLRALGYQV